MPPPDSKDAAKPKVWQKATGPSAGLVQQHYVSIRQEELSRKNPDLLDDALSALAFRIGKPRNSLMVSRAFEIITKQLMEADLTINFDPEKWFTTENTYESYTQMYERATKGGITFLDDSDWKNPATARAIADDRVTFPQDWKNKPADPTHRGLKPGQQSGDRIMNQMAFGGQRQAFKLEKDGVAKPGIMSKNSHFNPKTKQIFAALNYGRRPHGSSTYYGLGYLKLHPKLKVNAFYYGNDTFEVMDTREQVHYLGLGLVLGTGNGMLTQAIIDSCYNKRSLGDTTEAKELLEGHIFGALPFQDNIVEVCIPTSYFGTVVGDNAQKFATKHGARLAWTS